jgi:parallel beta-helix repeat protein
MSIIIASSTSRSENAHFYCDGINDQIEINAAIQSLDGRGGNIILLEGIFYISAPIVYSLAGTPDSNVTLGGQGDSTVLMIPSGHSTSMSLIVAGAEQGGLSPTINNLVFKDFRIDNNSANVTGLGYNGIMLWAIKGAIIENVTIETSPPYPPYADGGYGFIIINSSDILVKNCNFNQWEINGLEVRTTSRIIVSDCHFNNSRFEIYSNCTDFKITNNIFRSTECYWGTDNLPSVINGLEITGNTYRDCKAIIGCAEDIIISGNVFRGVGSGVILGYSTKNILISGNYFSSNHQLRIDGVWFRGISLSLVLIGFRASVLSPTILPISGLSKTILLICWVPPNTRME